jgi:hypothetical protein
MFLGEKRSYTSKILSTLSATLSVDPALLHGQNFANAEDYSETLADNILFGDDV